MKMENVLILNNGDSRDNVNKYGLIYEAMMLLIKNIDINISIFFI